jgi:Exonuclease VII small subunit
MAQATVVVTFEDGYQRLKAIVERLDAGDVSVHESCELFARGKGLEHASGGRRSDHLVQRVWTWSRIREQAQRLPR